MLTCWQRCRWEIFSQGPVAAKPRGNLCLYRPVAARPRGWPSAREPAGQYLQFTLFEYLIITLILVHDHGYFGSIGSNYHYTADLQGAAASEVVGSIIHGKLLNLGLNLGTADLESAAANATL